MASSNNQRMKASASWRRLIASCCDTRPSPTHSHCMSFTRKSWNTACNDIGSNIFAVTIRRASEVRCVTPHESSLRQTTSRLC